MPPKRKAVDDGSTAQRSTRPRRACTARVSQPSDAGESSSASAMASGNVESSKSRPKRNPTRSAKKDPWSEEQLLTSTKSRLIDIDLVKLLAHPRAWEVLNEEEKKEILRLLPDNVHPNPDPDPEDPNAKIPPLPQTFLRYSNNWRDAVRQFQVDLQAGRYDPEWQRQAAEAMEERAEGKFDKFKEEEFEEFWGQKQKLDYSVIAGESSRVKLDTLIQHGVVKKGDVWKYTRVFGRKDERVLVEKEARILDIDGSTLTFAIPAGRRVFLSNVEEKPQIKDTAKQELSEKHDISEAVNGTTDQRPGSPMDEDPKSESPDSESKKPKPNTQQEEPKEKPLDLKEEDETTSESELSSPPSTSTDSPVPDPEDVVVEVAVPVPAREPTSQAAETVPESRREPSSVSRSSPEAAAAAAEQATEQVKDIILPNVAGPGALANKILQVDGRITNPPNGNAWKEFRCYRNNQDMGSLWEVRQAWFLKQQK
ncbi:hypothetical protein VTN00DRAFT_8783 [Thermoascus crustaceus]|uniref:uncharacterized protein n=1 Tax=Thermoascus crustaceus TaxID=5088 RepID=UPI00374370C1